MKMRHESSVRSLSVLAAAVAFTAGAEIKIVSFDVKLNDRLARAEARVKIEGWTEDAASVRLRFCIDRDSRSMPITRNGEYFIATPLRDPRAFAEGLKGGFTDDLAKYQPTIELVADSARRYDEGLRALDRARLHFTEMNGPAKPTEAYPKDPSGYGFPIHKFPYYTGKPEWVMPVGAGELSAMVSWGVNDLHVNLSKTDYFLPASTAPYIREHVTSVLSSPGHVTVLFGDLDSASVTGFDQLMDPEHGRVVVTVNTKNGDLVIELFGDRETGAIIGEVNDSRKNRKAGVCLIYKSEHEDLENSFMIRPSMTPWQFPRIVLHEDYATDARYFEGVGRFYSTGVTVHGTAVEELKDYTNRLERAIGVPKGAKSWFFTICSKSGTDCNAVRRAEREATERLAKSDMNDLKVRRDAWWNRYWEESNISVTGNHKAAFIERLWYEQLYVWASVGYGKVPPKFNGGAGLVLGDSRSWGAGIWTQNTREEIWPLGAANHREFMENFVRYYESCRGNFETYWEKTGWGIGGFKMAETISSSDSPFLKPSTNAAKDLLSRPYEPPAKELIAKYREYRAKHQGMGNIMSSGTEILQQMVDYVRYYGDKTFIPAVAAWLRDQTELYLAVTEKGEDGKWHVYDTFENESWACPEDCLVDVCAARFCFALTAKLGKEFGYPKNLIKEASDRYRNFADLPTAAVFEMDHYFVESKSAKFEPGDKVYTPYRNMKIGQRKGNVENNELYAVYPFTMGDRAKNVATFRQGSDAIIFGWEPVGAGWGWYPVPMWASRLCLPDAADYVYNFAVGNNTWPFGGGRSPAAIMYKEAEVEDCPYLDSAGVLQAATQELFLQSHAEEPSAELFTGGPIRLIPAVDRSWSGSFRLLARGGFLVDCAFTNGKVSSCTITSTRGGELKYIDPVSGKVVKRNTRTGEKIVL